MKTKLDKRIKELKEENNSLLLRFNELHEKLNSRIITISERNEMNIINSEMTTINQIISELEKQLNNSDE